MSKDQAIGGAILVVCVVVAIGYLVTLFYPTWLHAIGLIGNSSNALQNAQFWVIAIPVFVAFVAILFIVHGLAGRLQLHRLQTNRGNHRRTKQRQPTTANAISP
jgi:hypothetical protein